VVPRGDGRNRLFCPDSGWTEMQKVYTYCIKMLDWVGGQF